MNQTENWQVEINRLNKMRLDLGLNMNQVEKLTGVNRSRLKGFFEFTNIPSMKFYFDVKKALEIQFEVKFKDAEFPEFPQDRKGVSFMDDAKEITKALKIPKEYFDTEKAIKSVSEMKIIGKEVYLDFDGAMEILRSRGRKVSVKETAKEIGYSEPGLMYIRRKAPKSVAMVFKYLKENMLTFEDLVKERE